jgi:hypothetical protein
MSAQWLALTTKAKRRTSTKKANFIPATQTLNDRHRVCPLAKVRLYAIHPEPETKPTVPNLNRCQRSMRRRADEQTTRRGLEEITFYVLPAPDSRN